MLKKANELVVIQIVAILVFSGAFCYLASENIQLRQDITELEKSTNESPGNHLDIWIKSETWCDRNGPLVLCINIVLVNGNDHDIPANSLYLVGKSYDAKGSFYARSPVNIYKDIESKSSDNFDHILGFSGSSAGGISTDGGYFAYQLLFNGEVVDTETRYVEAEP